MLLCRRRDRYPKIEVFCAATGKPSLHREDASIVAIASGVPVPEARLPVLNLNDADASLTRRPAHALPLARFGRPPN